MRQRGINYDVGVVYGPDYVSRPEFDPRATRRDLTVIRDGLHCTAVRISGTDPDRLAAASGSAAALGLEVWVSPHLHDRSPAETMRYSVECARDAERLRAAGADIVFVLGCELTIFMNGIVPGDSLPERLAHPREMREIAMLGPYAGPLSAYLAEANAAVRAVFGGPVTYASGVFESPNWSLFDFASLDHYRTSRSRRGYVAPIVRAAAWGKPVVLTEVGCCAYRGAERQGGNGWAIVDPADPGRLAATYRRDEALQAREVIDMLTIAEHAGVAGVFVFTFANPMLPHRDDPRRDLDMAGYSLVATPEDGGPWHPKVLFGALADFYRVRSGRPSVSKEINPYHPAEPGRQREHRSP